MCKSKGGGSKARVTKKEHHGTLKQDSKTRKDKHEMKDKENIER